MVLTRGNKRIFKIFRPGIEEGEELEIVGAGPEDPRAEMTLLETPVPLEAENVEEKGSRGIGPFRFAFNLRNFLPGADSSLRRFSVVEAALLLMTAYIASRGLGVVRQSIFNALFGTGPEANAFYAAVRLPDTLFNLIAGGALSQAFIPVFVLYSQQRGQPGQREAWRLTSLIFNVMLVALTVATVVAEFLTPAFVNSLLVPGYPPAEQTLTTTLTRIMLIQPLLLGLGSIVTSVLSSKRQFLLPALSIAIYNFGLIGGLCFSLAFPGVGIYGPTYGTIVAALLQFLIQLPALLKQGFRYSWFWNLRYPGLHQVLRLLVPGALAVIISSIALTLDTAFISYFPDAASLSAVHNADMLFSLPVALFAQAIGQAALPKLSLQAATRSYVLFQEMTLKVIGAGLLLSVLAVALLCLLGGPTIRIIFQHGAFDEHSSTLTFLALVGYAVGMPGTTMNALLANAFYALKDARTPLFISILLLAARIGIILLLLHLLTGDALVLVIPLTASVIATLSSFLLALILFPRLRKRIRSDTNEQSTVAT
jgi:putative peptidoglycan lipid II flippase